MKRKGLVFCFVIILVVITITAGCTAAPKSYTSGPIKIGHIRPLTGHMSIAGEFMVKGLDLAVDVIGNEVNGRPIEILVEDSAADSALAIDKARKLVEQDKVDVIIGPTVGGTQLAVSNYLQKVGIPNVHTNPSPITIIQANHEWTIQAGGSEPLLPSVMGRYAYEELGYRTVNCITGDWIPGHGFMDAFMDSFKRAGGEIVSEQYPPVATADLASYLVNFKDADAVAAWFDGTDSIRFHTQYYDFGVWKRMPLIGAFHGSFLPPFILVELPTNVSDALLGTPGPTPYTPLLDTEASKQFVEAYMKKYPDDPPPDDTQSGPFQGYQIVYEALKATGGDTTPEKLREAILNTEVIGPEGPVRFDKEKRSAIKNVYIFKVDKIDGEFTWIPVHTYENVPATGY